MQAACRQCGKIHTALTLDALKRLMRLCCKVKQPKQVIETVAFTLSLPVEVQFDRRVLSQNKTTYAHWSTYDKDKKDWVARVKAQSVFAAFMLPWSAWELIDLRGPGSKEYDHANLVGGAKPLVDCLVKQHVIKDDASKYFTCEYKTQTADSSGTILRLLHVKQ